MLRVVHAQGQTGTVLAGRYRLLERVASGGMGTVHRARDERTGRDVAIKLVAAGPGAEELTRRFHREARILSDLSHPAVVGFVDFGSVEDGTLYLVMEWLGGLDLSQRLREGVLGVRDTIRLARRVAEALSAAHDRGIVHRDVKPANIFLVGGTCDDVKVLDFGIALFSGRSTGITRTGMTVGTPEYMPPEQARGERTMDARVDVYALGCVIFQCVSGHPPFFGPTAAAVIAEVLLTEAPRLSARADLVPPPLDDLVAAMLAKDPRKRPGSARAVADELGAIEGRLEPTPDPVKPAVSTDERRLATVVGVRTEPNDPALQLATTIANKHEGELVVIPGRGAIVVFVADSAVQGALSAARAAREIALSEPALHVGLVAGQASVRRGLDPALAERAFEIASVAGEVRIDEAARSLIGGALDVQMTEAGPVVRGDRRVEQTAAITFVGREREIGALTSMLDAVITDRVAHLVVVTAPPGLGKTRLTRELLDRIRQIQPRPAVLDGRAEELRRGTPYAALGALVKRGLAIAESAPPDEQRAALREAVASLADPSSVERVSDFVGLAAGIEPARIGVEVAAALRDPQLMHDQIERATIQLFDALATRFGGLVVLLDDAHLADVATMKIFARAHRRLAERQLYIALFGRPELHEAAPPGLFDVASQWIQLGGLPRRAAERIVVEALGDRVSEATVERIVAHAEGNPLFLQELCASRLESKEEAPPAVPPTVLASVEARLLRLDPSARKVLRAASVFGDAFWQSGLLELLGPDASESKQLGDWLVHLVDRGIFLPRRQTRFAGEPELAFRHPLLREAAYGMLPPADRAEGHRRAAVWLAGAGERDPAVLGEHHFAAGDKASAARYFLHAAQLSLARNDLIHAAEHAERALEGELGGEDQARAHTVLCEAMFWRSEQERGAEHGRAAMQLTPKDTQPWMAAASALVRCLARTGDPEGIEVARDLVRAARTDPTLTPNASALPLIVASSLRAGLRALASDILDVFGRTLARAEDPVSRAHILTCRSWEAMFDGDYAACVAYDTEVLRCMQEAGDVRQACLARVHVGYDYLILGAYDRAAQELSAAQEEAERFGLDSVEQLAKHNLSLAIHRLGDSERGLELQRECLAHAIATHNQLEIGHARHYLALILFERGEIDAAETELLRVLAQMPTSALRWETLARLAAISLRRGDLEDARDKIEEATQGVDQLRNAEEGDGYVRLVAVHVERAAGDEQKAAALLVAARNRLLWRAGRIADATLRRSFMRAIPEHAMTLELAEQLASAGRGR